MKKLLSSAALVAVALFFLSASSVPAHAQGPGNGEVPTCPLSWPYNPSGDGQPMHCFTIYFPVDVYFLYEEGTTTTEVYYTGGGGNFVCIDEFEVWYVTDGYGDYTDDYEDIASLECGPA